MHGPLPPPQLVRESQLPNIVVLIRSTEFLWTRTYRLSSGLRCVSMTPALLRVATMERTLSTGAPI